MSDPSKKEPLKKITQDDLDKKSADYMTWRETHDSSDFKYPLANHDLTGLFFREWHQYTIEGVELLDLRNINFSGSDLSGVDISDAYLSGTNFTGANLSRAILTNAKFCKPSDKDKDKLVDGAILIDTKFLNATMHGADLRESLTAGMQLGGADVTNAKLPEEIKSFEGLKTVEEASKISKRLFTMLLSALGFSLLTILSTKDVPLLTNSTTSPLPIIQAPVPVASFYWITPVLLTGFFIYFLLNLLHLYKLISRLPAVFPDGIPLDEKMYPWLLNTLVREYFPILKKKKVHLFLWRRILIEFLTWWFTPIVLVCFWFRYLPRHDFMWSYLHIFCIALVVFMAIDAYFKAIQTLKNNPNHLRPLKYFCQLSGMALSLALLINITNHAKLGDLSNPYRRPVPDAYQTVGKFYLNAWLSANFVEQDVSHKPDNWDKAKPTEGVKGAKLEGANLDHANADVAFLVKAKLSGASLKHAHLSNANLTEAEIVNSCLTEANLFETDLTGADLTGANLTGANLTGAKAGANLTKAKLFGANLTEANLTGANLTEAKLFGADLIGTNLTGANLNLANLIGADLAGAHLSELKVFNPDSIKEAYNWRLAFYDPDIKNQLNLNDAEIKIELCAYLTASYSKLSEKDLGALYNQEVKKYQNHYGSGFVTPEDKPCKRDETPAPAPKEQ